MDDNSTPSIETLYSTKRDQERKALKKIQREHRLDRRRYRVNYSVNYRTWSTWHYTKTGALITAWWHTRGYRAPHNTVDVKLIRHW